ncbi:MAG: phosphate-starvation-inducible PsiE family protein [Desulfuromonadales bacterium]
MSKYIDRIESVILWALVLMLLLAVLLSTLELGRILFGMIVDAPPYMLISPKMLFQTFGLFLICLIGLELIKLLKFHITHHFVRPELVVEVAVIALCNKVVTLDLKETDPISILGLAALIFSLSAGYYVFSKCRNPSEDTKETV